MELRTAASYCGMSARAQSPIRRQTLSKSSEGSDGKLQFTQSPDGLHVQLPAQAPAKYAYALRVKFGR